MNPNLFFPGALNPSNDLYNIPLDAPPTNPPSNPPPVHSFADYFNLLTQRRPPPVDKSIEMTTMVRIWPPGIKNMTYISDLNS